jgi:protoporphyrinogen oxidase
MVARLERQGVRFRFDSKVQCVERLGPDRLRIHAGQGDDVFDRLVWTGPPIQLAERLVPREPALIRRASHIDYVAATCLILFLKERLSDYYWINTIDADITFGGAIEHTNLVPPEEYGGVHVLYLVNYLPPTHRYMGLTPDALLRVHWPSLCKLYPSFREALIDRAYLFKTPAASPVYDLGFGDRMPPFTGWSSGIGIAGMPQVYPLDRNMNHCVQVALQADLEALLASPAPQPRRHASAVAEPLVV